MKFLNRRISSTGLRARLALVALLGLSPLLMAVVYPALVHGQGSFPSVFPAGLIFAMAVLGIVLVAWWGDRLILQARPLSAESAVAAKETGDGGGELVSAEQALQLTRDRLRTVQRIGKIGNWDFDIASDRVWWSDETYEIFGLARNTPTFLLGDNEAVLALVHPEDRDRFQAAQKKFLAGSGKLDIEHRIVRADGQVRWVHALGESVLEGEGRPVTLSGTVQDITERRLASDALRASEAQFHQLVDAMPQIVCIMRAEGWLTYFNQMWLDYTGLSMEKSLGKGWRQLIHPEDQARVAERWALAAESWKTCEIEYRLRRADGEYRWMLGRAHPWQEAGGQPTRWLGTFTDIEDLKVATALLEKNMFMNRVAGRMARLGSWTIDLPESKLTWSDENCAIHDQLPGYVPTLEEGIGYFLPEDQPRVRRLVEACAQHGTPYEFVLPKMTAKGRRIWVRSLGEAVRDASGNIVRLQGAFQDITEQKADEARMLALETRLMSTLDSITDGFSLMDKDERFVFLNGQAERMLQRGKGELLGKNLWQEFSGIAGTYVEREYRAAVAEQRSTRIEAYYKPLKTWFVFNVYPTEVGTAVYFQDITQRRAEQAQLRLLETAVSRLNDIVIVAKVRPGKSDPEIVFVNHAFERLTGYRPDEAIGQSPNFLWGPKSEGTAVEQIRAAVRSRTPLRAEVLNYTKAGRERWVEIDITPIANTSGKLTHWVAVERDITERKQQQQEIIALNTELEQRVLLRTGQLAEVNKELESFAYSVSHDLRSPLNTVDGFSQLLLKSEADRVSEKGRHYLDRIRASVKQMGDLIEGLLTLAHLSREELRSEPVDLSALCRAIEQTQREREPQRQVQVHIHDGLTAYGDPRLLSAVVQNLMGNAWKFSAREPLACIEVGSQPGPEGDDVFFIRDNGAGFDMAFAHKLFGTFERLHSPGDFPGTGIGLATVKRVIERHNGHVWAESKPGEGATFYFTFGERDARPPAVK